MFRVYSLELGAAVFASALSFKKREKMNKRLRIQMIVAVVLTAFGMALISAAFVVPPLGVIHQSVLAVTGEIFSLVGALLIFDYRYRKFNQDKNV